MAENKSGGKIIVLNKKLIIVIVLAALAIAVWFLFFNKGVGEYIRSDSPILGNLSATVNMIEFSDYECPFCQAAEGVNQDMINDIKNGKPDWQAPVPNIIKEYVDTGKVRLIFRQFPVHPTSIYPSLASKCAQEQGKFWEYHKILFQNYNALDTTNLKKYAANLSLNISQFNDCFDSKKYEQSIQTDLTDGQNLGVSGTPTFFIGNDETGYVKIVGAASFSDFKQVIDSKL